MAKAIGMQRTGGASSPRLRRRTDFFMFDPGCSCVPWDWCEHNPERPILNTALAPTPNPESSFETIELEHLEHIRSILAD